MKKKKKDNSKKKKSHIKEVRENIIIFNHLLKSNLRKKRGLGETGKDLRWGGSRPP